MIGVRRHPDERELLDGYHGDAGEATRAVQDHLSHCPPCADAYARLAADLDRLASLGRLEAVPCEPPGSWDAQAARIEQRLGTTRRPDGAVAGARGSAGGPGTLSARGRPRRWSLVAALGTAAAVTLVTWASWTPPGPSVVATAPEPDQADDQLLQDIEALLEGPLASLGRDGSGWPGAAVPTLSAL